MSLKEQMLKAGLISESEARQATHKKRVDDKVAGRQQREQRAAAARRDVERQQESAKARDQRLGRDHQARQAKSEQERQVGQRQESAVAAAYREGGIANWEGTRRYYYAVNGRIDFVMVSEEAGRKLEAGQAAIVASERNPARHILLAAGAARRLRDIAPERVVVCHAS